MIDVLITGAGPVGLTLAADLLRWGVSFRIVDKKPGPEKYSKAANFWPRTQEVAEAIGFRAAVRERAVVARGTTVYAFGRWFVNGAGATRADTPYGETLAVNQGQIEQILHRFIIERGGRIEYDTTVTRVEPFEEYVETTLEAEGRFERIRSRYVVACDGSKGGVRDQVGLGITPIPLPGRALQQTDARLRWSRRMTHDHVWFFLMEDGFMGVVALPDGYTRIFICESADKVPNRPPTLEEMQAKVRRIAADPYAELSDAEWLTHGRFQYGVAERFRAGRVFLAGDAGHMTIPIGGQGMNTGIQDAFNLGWKLAAVLQGWAPLTLLESYSPERQRVRHELAEDQRANFMRLMHPSGLQKFAMTNLAGLMKAALSSIELGDRDETQLSIHYPATPLSEDHLGKSGLKAGDRALDAPVVRLPEREPVWLYQAIYGLGWSLFAFDANGAATQTLTQVLCQLGERYPALTPYLVSQNLHQQTVAGLTVLLDVDRFAHQAYQVKAPTLFLVRPDGHVGFRGSVEHIAALQAYCQRFLLPGQRETTFGVETRLAEGTLE